MKRLIAAALCALSIFCRHDYVLLLNSKVKKPGRKVDYVVETFQIGDPDDAPLFNAPVYEYYKKITGSSETPLTSEEGGTPISKVTVKTTPGKPKPELNCIFQRPVDAVELGALPHAKLLRSRNIPLTTTFLAFCEINIKQPAPNSVWMVRAVTFLGSEAELFLGKTDSMTPTEFKKENDGAMVSYTYRREKQISTEPTLCTLSLSSMNGQDNPVQRQTNQLPVPQGDNFVTIIAINADGIPIYRTVLDETATDVTVNVNTIPCRVSTVGMSTISIKGKLFFINSVSVDLTCFEDYRRILV